MSEYRGPHCSRQLTIFEYIFSNVAVYKLFCKLSIMKIKATPPHLIYFWLHCFKVAIFNYQCDQKWG